MLTGVKASTFSKYEKEKEKEKKPKNLSKSESSVPSSDYRKKIKDLKTQLKEYQNKYVETKMLLSRVQMQNADLQREVWELKHKLNGTTHQQ